MIYCWSDPDDNKDSGVCPFVFDVPDMATYNSIKLFQIVTVQLAGFAHEISAYKNDEDYEKSQQQIPMFASESREVFNYEYIEAKEIETSLKSLYFPDEYNEDLAQ